MAQENRYPSPEPTNVVHPYHNSQHQMSSDQGQHLQHAPTAMMHDQAAHGSSMAQNLQYVAQYGPPQPSTPQQLAQQTLNIDGQSTDPSVKKKTKVSRACDECRRKKVRCDAESDQPGVQCANCKRASTTCQFSRQPQKRGPSKGYIKELAERVSRLEYPSATSPDMPYSTLSHGVSQPDQQAYPSSLDFNASNQRKRTHSMVDGPQNYVQGQDQLQEYSRGSAPIPHVAYSGANNGMMQAPVYDLPTQTGGAVSGLNQGDLEGYFGRIHATLPLLPESHFELQSILERIPASIHEAFRAALAIAVRSGHSTVDEAHMRSTADLCLSLKSSTANDLNLGQHLVHLQALILMAIADELNGPAFSRNATWLGAAVTFANSLHLQKIKYTEAPNSSDINRLLRRAWLSLVMLDRWHAASICSTTLIHDESVQLIALDDPLLGSNSYHLLRISLALGHLSNAFLYHDQDFSEKRPSGRIMVELMRGEVQRIEEGIESRLPQMPLVHLALLHIKILKDKAAEIFYSSDTRVVDAALRVVSILQSAQHTASPFEHHFAALAANTLSLAIDLEPTPITESLNYLRQLCETSRLSPAWRTSISLYTSSQLEAHRTKAVAGGPNPNRDGLQHLADAAVGANRNTSQERIDWSSITAKGYLRAFE